MKKKQEERKRSWKIKTQLSRKKSICYEKIKPRESTHICLIEVSEKEKNDSEIREIIKIIIEYIFTKLKKSFVLYLNDLVKC